MMRLFLAGLVLLLLAFFVHVVAWRLRLPRRSIRALLGIFAATPLVVVPIYFAIEPSPAFIDASGAVRILLFYVSCSLVYVVLYSAIESKSPSLAIVSHLASCGGGLSFLNLPAIYFDCRSGARSWMDSGRSRARRWPGWH
jgi:hypothetical protein